MYGWELLIQDSASGALNAITQNLNTATGAALSARTTVASVGTALNQTPTIAKTASERIGEMATAALDVQRAVEYMTYPIEALPERWQSIRTEIVNAAMAINSGDWSAAGAAISSGINEAMGTVNDFRTSWSFVKEGFTSAKTIFTETWGLFSQNAMGAISTVKTLGLTFVTQTLPAVLTFVGQGVVSLVGFVASLMGATGAQAALNAVMLANPIGLIVAGIVAIGLAVYGLIKYWDDIKGYLVDFTNFFIQNNPFSWIANLVGYVFPNFKTAVVETFQSIFGWIDTYFIQPISKVMSWLGEQISGITNEVNTAIAANSKSYDELMGKNNAPLPGLSAPLSGSAVSDSVGNSAQSLGKKRGGGGLDSVGKAQSIEGGGGQIKNINIHIDKLVETVQNNFQSGGQMDERKIREAVTRALVDGVNDFNRQ